MLQPGLNRGFVRPHAAPPPELLVNSVVLPSIIGRARSNTVSTPQSCPPDARAALSRELQYVRRQVSRLERENAELQAENAGLQASNKRLWSENARLQDDQRNNAGLQPDLASAPSHGRERDRASSPSSHASSRAIEWEFLVDGAMDEMDAMEEQHLKSSEQQQQQQ